MERTRNPRVIFKGHASQRGQQRGVKTLSAFLAAIYGEPVRAAGRTVRRTVTNKVAEKLAKLGWSSHAVSQAKGTAVITAEDGPNQRVIITVLPNEGRSKRYRKPKYGLRKPTTNMETKLVPS